MKKRFLLSLFLLPLVSSCGQVPPSGGDDPYIPPEVNTFPKAEIESFLEDENITFSMFDVNVEESGYLEYSIDEDSHKFSLLFSGNKVTYLTNLLTSNNFTLKIDCYVDASNKVAASLAYVSANSVTNMDIYKYVAPVSGDDFAPYQESDTNNTGYIDLAQEIGNISNLSGTTKTIEDTKFSFSRGTGSTSPVSSKTSTEKIKIYENNTLTITRTGMLLIDIKVLSTKGNSLTPSEGTVRVSNNVEEGVDLIRWKGECDELTFTVSCSQVRIKEIKIWYLKPVIIPPGDLSTVASTLTYASSYPFVPNDVGYAISTVGVSLSVTLLTAMDSQATSTKEGYDVNAQGKVLAYDDTGFIILSSPTDDQKVTLYEKAKSDLKGHKTATYKVFGYLSIFNNVVEVNVTSFQADTTFVNKPLEEFTYSEYTSQSEVVNDIVNNTIPNGKGYGVNKVVKLNNFTCFNCYNPKGSYLFLDANKNLLPIYSLENKDDIYLDEGKSYNIIGLETLYRNRPSIHILKATKVSDEGVDIDLSSATEVTSFDSFYTIAQSTNENYVKSELTLYKATVFVSSYSYKSYTVNTSYVYRNKTYTTGTSEIDAANLHSLGVFNDGIWFRGTLDPYLLDEVKDQETADSLAITIYFTLAYLRNPDGKNMWSINVLEDYI